MSHPSIDHWALQLAHTTASRATCHRRQVGCVLLNGFGHVLATGYNGVAAGMPHCRGGLPGNRCPGADSPSGQNLDGCQAIHAEQNALLQCHDVQQIATAYVTASPCVTCVKLLLNTGCRRIIFSEEYPHEQAKELWQRTGRIWCQLPI